MPEERTKINQETSIRNRKNQETCQERKEELQKAQETIRKHKKQASGKGKKKHKMQARTAKFQQETRWISLQQEELGICTRCKQKM